MSMRRRGLLTMQQVCDRFQEGRDVQGFRDVAGATRLQEPRFQVRMPIGGDRDNRGLPRLRIGLELTSEGKTVDVGELKVHKDQVGTLALDPFKQIPTVLGLQDGIAGHHQKRCCQLPIRLIILHDQNDRLAHLCSIVSGLTSDISGRQTVNVLPRPAPLEATRILPPCSSTSCLMSVSPRPVPPDCLVKPDSSCVKRWNSLGISSAAIPIPVSVTAMSTALGLSSEWNIAPRSLHSVQRITFAVTVTRPSSGVNLMALESRFRINCLNRTGSAVSVGGAVSACSVNIRRF